LHGRTVSEKLPKIPLFGHSLINRLRLLGSQQHSRSGVLITSFSTWGTENSLAEINLESPGVIKGCNIFWVKNWHTLAALWAGALSCNKKKSREQKSSFIIRRTTVLGMLKDPAIIIDAILGSFSEISNSSNIYLSSSQFWTATSLVIFYHQLPSVSKS
jgi:hypothetical protein